MQASFLAPHFCAVSIANAPQPQPIAACLISGDADARLRQLTQDADLAVLQKPLRPTRLRQLLRDLHQNKAG